jgi:hypothetical protein
MLFSSTDKTQKKIGVREDVTVSKGKTLFVFFFGQYNHFMLQEERWQRVSVSIRARVGTNIK